MANPNFLNHDERKEIIDQIQSDENLRRKQESYKQQEVFNGNLRQYVREHLEGQLDAETVKNMPIISTINILKRVVTSEATVYSDPPVRKWSHLDEDQQDKIELIYKDAKTNSRMASSNKCFKMQNQNFVMVVPKKGKLQMRVLKKHNLDVVPDEDDPETAFAYITSAYDASFQKDTADRSPSTGERGISNNRSVLRDETNQKIAEADDYKAKVQRYVVWTNELNFKMDGRGDILLPDGSKIDGDISPNDPVMEFLKNPLHEQEVMPIVELSIMKEFEFFVRQEDETTTFTIQFNGSLSDVNQIVRLQGWSQAVVKGPEKMMMEQYTIGPNLILKLIHDPEKGVETDFDFKSPNSDIPGSIEWLRVLLSLFLSAKGIDPKVISSTGDGVQYNSGIDRLLALFEKFSVNKEDFTIYREGEEELYKIFSAYHNVLRETELLDKKYIAAKEIPPESEVGVIFNKPDAVQSEDDRVDTFVKKRAEGLTSAVEYVAKENKVSEGEALSQVVKTQLYERLVEESAMSNGHAHEGLAPAIERGEGHTHLDFKTGKLVSIEADGEGHTHALEEGRSGGPVDGVIL